MAQSSKPVLRQNPFTAYREPDTGRWIIVHPSSEHGDSVSEPVKRVALEPG
ncbi:MAG: hypothetical protein AAFR31_00180 [Cyanobacteria bacterium J06627_8]